MVQAHLQCKKKLKLPSVTYWILSENFNNKLILLLEKKGPGLRRKGKVHFV